MPDAQFWRGEIARAKATRAIHEPAWQENIDYYTGQSKDAKAATTAGTEWVNVNVDFYQVELKQAQLFYETPDLQLTAKGPFRPIVPAGQPAPPMDAGPILQAHRALLNELLGPDHADVLTTIQKAIKDCLCPAGFGATKIGYESVSTAVQPPEQLGSVLGLKQDVQFPVYESWYWTRIPSKKLLIPADFKDTDHDKAPWLGHEFRMPLTVGRRQFARLPQDFEGTTTRDEKVFTDQTEGQDASDLAYLEGQEIWYRAALFDETVVHPQLFKRVVLVDGVDDPVVDEDSPCQERDPQTGRLTADSCIGNPIHILTLRDVPDSAYVPSDSQMTRPLVRELCRFRTQMVQARDANRSIVGYDTDKMPPETVDKITKRELGDLIPLEGGALAAGAQTVMAELRPAGSNRQDYTANDYIQRDIDKTLAIDATGAGVTDEENESATKTAEVARNRNVRIDAERRRVLQWYLKGVQKFSALVCRYMTPALAVPYIGQDGAQAWGSWNKKTTDGRFVFGARPDSQIRLDAAQERRSALQLYQMVANDPNIVRVELLKDLMERSGRDPGRLVVDTLPEQKPEPNVAFSFKGEDFIGPQAPVVFEILAQGGIEISQQARDDSAGQLFKQMTLGLRDASGKTVPAQKRPAQHGGPAEQVRPLNKQIGDQTGQRPGVPVGAPA